VLQNGSRKHYFHNENNVYLALNETQRPHCDGKQFTVESKTYAKRDAQ